MSEDYFPVCYTCKVRYEGHFASASGFHAMRTPFRDSALLEKLEAWLGAHERHDIRIVWEQDELPWPDPWDVDTAIDAARQGA